MAAHPVTHPSAAALQAFALGKLNDSSSAALINHLDSCPDCCKQVAALSGDDFLNRLRQASSRSSTPAPRPVTAESSTAPQQSPRQSDIPRLPPELANNPQYEILKKLGRGGMGVVYLAKNKLMDRLEVIKVINKVLLDHPGAVERFLREIRSTAKLNHANVVTAHSAAQFGELLILAMEYIEGQDLASLVKAKGPLPIVHACYYIQQAAAGLHHAFEKGMVHRDIKPQNLILAREGKRHIVKVLDFGLAKVMREKGENTGLTGEGKMLGTPDYIAPEQTLDAAKADIRADIYSLGCTLYYLLAGHPPFSADSLGAILLAHQMQEPRPLNLVRPEVPEELAAVVRKMMAKTPAKRYQTPSEVAQILTPFIKQGAAPKPSLELSSSATDARPAGQTAPPGGTPPAHVRQETMQAEPAAAWESLTERTSMSVGPRREEARTRPGDSTNRNRSSQKKWLVGGGVAVGVLVLTLLGMWATGVIKVKTAEGGLIVEVSEPNCDVYVDGERITVAWNNGGKKAEIRVKAGIHKVEVRKDGFRVDATELTFEDGDKIVFTARLLPTKPHELASVQDDAKGFMPLFNGRDKTGWIAHSSQPDNWRVEKGVLVGSGPATSHLFTKRNDFKDFHLRIEARINDGGQGGVYFRTPYSLDFPARGAWFTLGYGVKINDNSPVDRGNEPYTGTVILLASANPIKFHWERVRKSPVPFGEWFRMEVIAEGNHIVVKVNDKAKNEYTDPERLFKTGHIALQQFDRASVVEFRKIEIKELEPHAGPKAPLQEKTPRLSETKEPEVSLVTKRFPVVRMIPRDAEWVLEGAELVQRGVARTSIQFGDSNWGDYDFSLDAKMVDGRPGFVLAFRISYPNSFGLALDGANQQAYIPHSEPRARLFEKDTWYHVEIRVRGQQYEAFIDRQKIFSCTADDLPPKGGVGLETWRTSCRFRNLVVKDPKGKVLLEGLPDLNDR